MGCSVCCQSTRRWYGHISTPPVRPRRATQGAESNYNNSAIAEPEDHALGRSRGGLTTKIHALTDTATCPLVMSLTPGQAHDNPALLPLVDGYFRAEQTCEHRRQVRLLGDKAYSHPSTRAALRRRGINHTIPERDDQIAHRKAKGSAGGRPPAFNAEIYKQRNTIERGFNRLKQWRGVATRYDKYALTFLGGVLLAASIMRARTAIQN
jgi:putative transposase